MRVKLLLPTKTFAQWSSLLLDEFQEVLELLSITLEFLADLLVVTWFVRYNLILAAIFNP
jgi:hypothetical protein